MHINISISAQLRDDSLGYKAARPTRSHAFFLASVQNTDALANSTGKISTFIIPLYSVEYKLRLKRVKKSHGMFTPEDRFDQLSTNFAPGKKCIGSRNCKLE